MPSIPNDERFCICCGGELRHVRQRIAPHILTFLVCQMQCGWRKLMLIYDETTGEDREPTEADRDEL